MTRTNICKLFAFAGLQFVINTISAQKIMVEQTAYHKAGTVTAYGALPISIPNKNTVDLNVLFASKPKMMKSFAKQFPGAEGQEWIQHDKQYDVSFICQGKKSRAVFDGKGNFSYAISYCTLNDLPLEISGKFTAEYEGYHVFQAMEVKAHGSIAHHIILENAGKYITIKITDEGIEETETFVKAGSK